jgi:hypothetical protein
MDWLERLRRVSTEIYVSTDIEVDGPIPGPYSMLSIGSAAYTRAGTLVATFSANLEPLPNAREHPETMAWWAENPAAWAVSHANPQSQATVMQDYVAWLKQLPGIPVFVGYPVGFDFMFVYWYLLHFVGESPFARRALDVRTFAMAQLKQPYLAVSREQLPAHYRPEMPHTHQALEDALEQGVIFCTLLQENLQTQRGVR